MKIIGYVQSLTINLAASYTFHKIILDNLGIVGKNKFCTHMLLLFRRTQTLQENVIISTMNHSERISFKEKVNVDRG